MLTGQYKQIISLLPEPIMLVNPSGIIVATNKAGSNLIKNVKTNPVSLFDYLEIGSQEQTRMFVRHCARSKQPLLGAIHFNNDGQRVNANVKLTH